MNLEQTVVFSFTGNSDTEPESNRLLLIYAWMALNYKIRVQVVTTKERLGFWESELPNDPRITITFPTSSVMRKSPLPEKTAILTDWALSRGLMSIIRTKAFRQGVTIKNPT